MARHLLQQLVPRYAGIPRGTLLINVSGAFAIGFVFTAVVRHLDVAMWIQEAVLVGSLGGYTTFSTLALETYVLLEHDRYLAAGSYAMGTVFAGVLAVFVGIRLARFVA